MKKTGKNPSPSAQTLSRQCLTPSDTSQTLHRHPADTPKFIIFDGANLTSRGGIKKLEQKKLVKKNWSRKTVLRGRFGLLNGKDSRQFGEAMLYCSNWKGSDHTLGCEKENGCKAGGVPCFVAQVNGFIFFTSVKSL